MGSVAPCGAESEDIMLVESFVIGAISIEATTKRSTRNYTSSINGKEFHLYTGKLPNGTLLGLLNIFKDKLFFKRVIFAIRPSGEYQIIGYLPQNGKWRTISTHELNIMDATALQYGYHARNNVKNLIATKELIKF